MKTKKIVNVVALGLLLCPFILSTSTSIVEASSHTQQVSPRASTYWGTKNPGGFVADFRVVGGDTLQIYNMGAHPNSQKVDYIWDPMPLKDVDPSFQTSIKKIVFEDGTKVTGDMSHMFDGLVNVTEIQGLEKLDTSGVTNMSCLFSGVKTTSLNLSNFNTSKVTAMSMMFMGCTALESLDLSTFDTSKVTTMSMMFRNTNKLTSIDLSTFDTSKVSDMDNMFANTNIPKGVLKKITLGTKSTQFAQQGSAGLSVTKGADYTGNWVLESGNSSKSFTDKTLFSMYNDLGYTAPGTYVWEKKNGGAITVHYQDEQGHKISDDAVLSGRKVGDRYSTERKNIAGYTFKEVKGNTSGNFTAQAQTVTYVYTKDPVKAADVTVKYQDESGKKLSDNITLSGNIGDTYTSSKKTINGYDLIKTIGQPTGTFTDTAQEVTYVYKKQSTPTPTQKIVNVYRLYNKKSMQHLYTADVNEYNSLPKLSKDWVREGVNFKEYKTGTSSTQTIYRIYNPKSGEHLNTKDTNEIKVLKSQGWKTEGVAFYAPKTGGKAIYRLFNPKAGIGAHFVTGDANEKNVLTKAPKEWKYEGVAWRSVQ